MGFKIICDNCGNTQPIKDKNTSNNGFDGISLSITEDHHANILESIDIRCWNCNNEVKL